MLDARPTGNGGLSDSSAIASCPPWRRSCNRLGGQHLPLKRGLGTGRRWRRNRSSFVPETGQKTRHRLRTDERQCIENAAEFADMSNAVRARSARFCRFSRHLRDFGNALYQIPYQKRRLRPTPLKMIAAPPGAALCRSFNGSEPGDQRPKWWAAPRIRSKVPGMTWR
jgi:hypothetical protein